MKKEAARAKRALPRLFFRSGRARSPRRFQSKKTSTALDGALLIFNVGKELFSL